MRSWAKLVSGVTAIASMGAAGAAVVAVTVILSACTSCDSIVRQTALPVLATGNFDAVVADQAQHRIYFADQATTGAALLTFRPLTLHSEASTTFEVPTKASPSAPN